MKVNTNYELSFDEHRGMRKMPLVLPTDPPITISVAGRNGVRPQAGPAEAQPGRRGKLVCDHPGCGRSTSMSGKPFNAKGLEVHKWKAHGKRRKNGGE